MIKKWMIKEVADFYGKEKATPEFVEAVLENILERYFNAEYFDPEFEIE